jgi:hypothetical protein
VLAGGSLEERRESRECNERDVGVERNEVE